MNFEDKLQTIFKEQFQIKRISKEVQNLREAKQKLGLETRFSLTRGIHLTIFVEILPQKLKELKKLSSFRKLEFKIVMKSTYPTQVPRLYFLIENAVEVGLNPFHDYLGNVIAEWTPKITLIDIIKYVPSFLIKCLQGNSPIMGNPLLYEFFQVERLFIYHNIQTFPVRFVRNGQLYQGMLAIVNHIEVVLLEQTNFQGGYAITDFILIFEIQSVQKHKTKPICAMFEIKRGGSKFGVEFYSDQFDTIISTLSEAMKENFLIDDSKNESSESEAQETEESLYQKKTQNTELVITDQNISEIESQMTILQSLVESDPNSKNIKELVELLKKAVEYFSMKADPRFNIYLKQLQDIMANEFMQILLESESPTNSSQSSKKEYESIADLV